MIQGKIKRIFHDRKFGFIQTDTGQSVHFAASVVQRPARFEELAEGMTVSLEVGQGERGPTAQWVSLENAPQHSAITEGDWPPKPPYRFLNPYNFVRYYDREDAPDDPPELQLIGRCPPPPHDRWVGLSGKIECLLTVKTPLFISSGQPDADDPKPSQEKHHTYSFVKKNGKKYLPASSLRGPVRSVFEAVTNSCFATLTGKKRLSYRLDPALAGSLVPARLEKIRGQWSLRLLTGSAPLSIQDKPRELYPASLRLYKPQRSTSKNPNVAPPPKVDLSPLLELGEKDEHPAQYNRRVCFAVLLRLKFPPSWRAVAVVKTREEAEQWKNDHLRDFNSQADLRVANGVLCITNQNIDNKASERFFFQGGKAIVRPLKCEEGQKIPQVIQNYHDLLVDYYELHQDELRERTRDKDDKGNPTHDPGKPLDREHPGLSRFIIEDPRREDWEDHLNGEVVYTYLAGRGPEDAQPRFLAPVSIPRVAYDHTIGELLPKALHRCDDGEELCPACRTFGWVREAGGGQSQAYRGRVRFSDGKHILEKGYPRALTLAILGSPKPTTTRFYLIGPDGRPQFGRSDNAIGYDGNEGNNHLRGRKFYRHHMLAHFSEAERDNTGKLQESKFNRTIRDPEDEGGQFNFTVRFENLASEELGALLWSLELGGRGYHRMGYGKPLGLGSVEIAVAKVELMDPWNRYQSLEPRAGWEDATASKDQWVRAFQQAAVRRFAPREAVRIAKTGVPDWERAFLALDNLTDLLALLGKTNPILPVHYPRSSADPKDTKGSFEWFMGNKRQGGPKLELDLPVEDKGLPLINKRGEVWK